MKKIKFKRLALICAGVLLLTVFATVLALMPRPAKGAEALPSVIVEESEPDPVPSQPSQKGRLTLLLSGVDRASGLSDVLMLATLDRDTGEAWIMQLPRDTYVSCGSGSYRKMNGTPSALGGMEEFRDFMSESLGVPIHRYLRLSPDAFRRMVDAVGGVEIELESALDYEDPAQGLSIHLPAGKQTLDGASAEQFVRFRSDYVRGDLGRIDAQKIFLSALLEQIRSNLSAVTLAKLFVALLGEVETDLSMSDLMSLSDEIMAVRRERVFFLTAPGSDVTSSSGGSFYVLSAPAMSEVLSGSFGGSDNGFDPQKVFLYAKSKEFAQAYQTYATYEVVSAEGIVTDGLGIQRKE